MRLAQGLFWYALVVGSKGAPASKGHPVLYSFTWRSSSCTRCFTTAFDAFVSPYAPPSLGAPPSPALDALQAFLAYNKGQGPLANTNSVQVHMYCDGWLAETKQEGTSTGAATPGAEEVVLGSLSPAVLWLCCCAFGRAMMPMQGNAGRCRQMPVRVDACAGRCSSCSSAATQQKCRALAGPYLELAKESDNISVIG
eukprot:1159072-Pelagomonas_calceolata.AAC.2